MHRKLTKRIEDLTQDSMALKVHLVPQFQALNNTVPELVNFGFSVSRQFSLCTIYNNASQLAQLVMPHISDVRAAKSAFQLSNVLAFVTQTAGSTVGKGHDAASPWDAVGNFLTQIITEVGRIVPMSLEPENTVKSTSTPRL